MGQIERITFTSDETGYSVAKIKVYGRRDLVTVIGAIITPIPVPPWVPENSETGVPVAGMEPSILNGGSGYGASIHAHYYI
jgi:hypothetical protein